MNLLEWTRSDTLRKLLASRRGIGFTGYLEMVAIIASIAIVLGFLERAL